ncbi:hypothetical protein Aduo_013671 [Ancylostoma duodenale]
MIGYGKANAFVAPASVIQTFFKCPSGKTDEEVLGVLLKGQCEKGFRRLTKDQPVGLKYIGIVLSVVKEVTDATGFVQELIVRASPLTEQNKPKAFVHWVSRPATAEVRLYDRL